MLMDKENGSISLVLAIVFGVLFVGASVFGVWAFGSRQDYKDNTDKKIENAVVIAVQETETAKDVEFVEKEKQPTRTYKGSATYGSVSFAYPKTWSIYAEENTSGTVLDLYGFPGVVPKVENSQVYALRTEIVSKTYDATLKSYESKLKTGDLSAQAFRAENVPGVLGTRLDGAIETDKIGAVVLLPLRDKTLIISAEAPQYVNDFNTIILPSLKFVP